MANPAEQSRTVGSQHGEQQLIVRDLKDHRPTLNIVVFPPSTPTEKSSNVVIFSFKPLVGRLSAERTGGVNFRKKRHPKNPGEISERQQDHVEKRKRKREEGTLQDAAREARQKAIEGSKIQRKHQGKKKHRRDH